MKEEKTLNQWRKERGLGVDELAERAGVGRSIGSWLYGGKVPKLKASLALAGALGVEVTQIRWGEKEEPQPVPAMPPRAEVKGNRSSVTREQYEMAKVWVEAGHSHSEAADAMGVSRETYYKALRRFAEEDAPQKADRGPTPKAAGSKPRTPKAEAAKAVS
ncbi:helix-turn-helix domain-containing protein [Deinococcus humi]|uniref:DNA-binding XRE family transcriptional regulator n=1 Tax=Deinococcus humi TaxID=662880 RepID=A0A7W8K2G5_9DEIO|nr:helix-turn-helix transcriptional regulator [Deinococcus humi]MBB5366296.1 DNA-binding XRE family transcriptional regulator [Deinococcus humi]GGO33540.1 hypothetical protein GCM10008949_32880 [Deinococcus humi]